MKITIERGLLLKVLTHIQSIVERRNTIPILSNVKLEASGNQLSLNATDMDLDIVETVPADVARKGATTAPAHTLFDIVRKLADGAQVELDASGDNLKISSGRSRFTLTCLPVEDFPVLSGGDLPNKFALSCDDLKNLIDRTRFAISTEETRYYLNGIYLHTAERKSTKLLRSVATDGHRLACVDVALPAGAAGMPGVIVPRKTVGELRKLIDDLDGEVSVSLSDTKIRFGFEGAVLTSKLIDGTFPDYDRVIPTDNDKLLVVGTQQFREAVDRVSAISSERSRAVKMALSKGNLTLSVNSPDNDTATEEIPVAYDGADIEIGFNARYLLDIAQQIGGDEARFNLADAASPTLVQDKDDTGALYVLMPMRV